MICYAEDTAWSFQKVVAVRLEFLVSASTFLAGEAKQSEMGMFFISFYGIIAFFIHMRTDLRTKKNASVLTEVGRP